MRPFLILFGSLTLIQASFAQVRWEGNGNFYELVPTWRTWRDARAEAETRTFQGVRGHLVTITSQAEQDFIVSWWGELLREASIGAHREQGFWEWVTGERWEYSNWASGEPNGDTYGAFHGGGQLGQWNDRPNTDARHYFVEYDTGLRDVPPDAFQVTKGQHLFGTLEDMLSSNDSYVYIGARAPLLVSDPSAQVVVTAHAPSGVVRVIGARIESAASIFNVRQRVELFDFVAGRWISLDERNSTSNDSSILATTVDSPERFVEAITRRVLIRIGWFDRGAPAPGWQSRIDYTALAIHAS